MTYTELVAMPKGSVLIYKIENQNGHAYIGSTIEPKRRWAAHKKLLTSAKHTSFVLQKSWDKHGEQNHKFLPLFVCSSEMRFFYEHLAISAFGVFNLLKTPGQPPAGSMKGKKHKPESIKKFSNSATLRWEKEREIKYTPLCEKAWELVLKGTPKYKACKEVGISHSSFWLWISKNGHKEVWNK